MRRLVATLALIASAAMLVFALFGCSHKLTGVPIGNQPPHTTIFVQGPVDTVNHLVHLYWYGTDSDGYVQGYEIKLVNPEDTVAADSAWTFTSATDEVVAIYTPAGHAKPTFYVRAIDNKGLRDPRPAVETFEFRNHPPVVTWTTIPSRLNRSDTTFAAVTVAWTVSDPDGDVSKVNYRIWLDGNETHPDIVHGSLSYTVPSDRFLTAGGLWTTGPRTLYLQAIDDGGMAGNITSTTWYVKAPVANPNYTPGKRPGRLLIIDDVPKTFPQNFVDSLYANTAARNLPAGTWSVLPVDAFQPFKTSQDLAQTMQLFDAVIWYRAGQDSLPTLIQNFQPGLQSYIDSGGNLYIESLFLIQGVIAEGALTQDFLTNYLDCDGLRNNFRKATFDSSSGWGNRTPTALTSTIVHGGTTYLDTLTLSATPGSRFGNGAGIRVFNVRTASDIVMTGPRDTKDVGGAAGITPMAADSLLGPPLPVAINVAPTGGRGRVMIYSLPIAVATPRGSSHIPRVMAEIFEQLGLTGP